MVTDRQQACIIWHNQPVQIIWTLVAAEVVVGVVASVDIVVFNYLELVWKIWLHVPC